MYQWCGSEPMTKFGMVRAMGSALGMDTSHVRGNAEKPKEGDGATKRPRDTTMDRWTGGWEGRRARNSPFFSDRGPLFKIPRAYYI